MIVSHEIPVHNRTIFTSLDRATQSFRQAMEALGYSAAYCREACIAIREHQETATLVEMGLIDPDDESLLEAAFADGFDAVHPSSGAWGVVNDEWVALIPNAEEALAYAEMMGTFDTDDEPTDADWDDYHRWAMTLDASRPGDYLEAELAEIGIRR